MFDAKPISDTIMVREPLPEPPAVPSEEIHTIAQGHLIGHDRSPSCWCAPVQDADPRIWHHNGNHADHYPQWQTDGAGNMLKDAEGYAVPTPCLQCQCGRTMPQGRKGLCLACLTKMTAEATTDNEKQLLALLDKAAKG